MDDYRFNINNLHFLYLKLTGPSRRSAGDLGIFGELFKSKLKSILGKDDGGLEIKVENVGKQHGPKGRGMVLYRPLGKQSNTVVAKFDFGRKQEIQVRSTISIGDNYLFEHVICADRELGVDRFEKSIEKVAFSVAESCRKYC
jgi:hypothetical protein